MCCLPDSSVVITVGARGRGLEGVCVCCLPDSSVVITVGARGRGGGVRRSVCVLSTRLQCCNHRRG